MTKKKLKIYLDTSVISAFLDERQPERQNQTKIFWNTLSSYEVYISKLVRHEIAGHPDRQKRKKL